MPDEMNFSFLDIFRLKGEKTKSVHPKMFPTKLTKLQVGITFFLRNTQQQILCTLNSEKNLFQLSWELDKPKAIIPLPGSVLASPENIQTEAFSGY